MNKPHIIDVHQHCFPPDYRAVLERCGVTVHALLDSPIPKWSLEAHLAGMDKAGVAFGLLTITGGFIYSKALIERV